MAKRKRSALARKKTAAKRGKARARVKSNRRKVAKRAGRKTKAKKQETKPGAKRAAPKKATPQSVEPPRQPAGATEEAVIIDRGAGPGRRGRHRVRVGSNNHPTS
jgi:hypothetical protein